MAQLAEVVMALPAQYYQIIHTGWPVGADLIPVNTIIKIPVTSNKDPTAPWSQYVQDRGLLPPPNSMALDLATVQILFSLYPRWSLYPAPGLEIYFQ
jgi:hypothetical protein